jgi:hypothetical protein
MNKLFHQAYPLTRKLGLIHLLGEMARNCNSSCLTTIKTNYFPISVVMVSDFYPKMRSTTGWVQANDPTDWCIQHESLGFNCHIEWDVKLRRWPKMAGGFLFWVGAVEDQIHSVVYTGMTGVSGRLQHTVPLELHTCMMYHTISYTHQ